MLSLVFWCCSRLGVEDGRLQYVVSVLTEFVLPIAFVFVGQLVAQSSSCRKTAT